MRMETPLLRLRGIRKLSMIGDQEVRALDGPVKDRRTRKP